MRKTLHLAFSVAALPLVWLLYVVSAAGDAAHDIGGRVLETVDRVGEWSRHDA